MAKVKRDQNEILRLRAALSAQEIMARYHTPHMNTESIPTRKVKSGEMTAPGDFSFDDEFTFLYIILPGDRHPDAIPIQRGGDGGPSKWGWNGNEDSPTLTPSIHSVGHWHGYLRAGKLESC